VRVVIALALVLLVSGCIENEVTEFRILRLGGEPAILEVEESNFYSSEKDPAEVRKDFDSLIENNAPAKAAAEAKQEGISIKESNLFIRDGKIVLRITGIVPDLAAAGLEFEVKDSIVWTIDTKDDDKVETNG